MISAARISTLSLTAKHLVQGFSDGSFIIWEFGALGVQYRLCAGLPSACSHITLSSNSCHLLGSSGLYARVWSVHTGLPVGPPMRFNRGSLFQVLSPFRGVQVFAVDQSVSPTQVYLLDVSTGTCIYAAPGPTSSSSGNPRVLVSSDHTTAAVLSSLEICLYQLDPLSLIGHLRYPDDSEHSPAAADEPFIGAACLFETATAAFIESALYVTVVAKTSPHKRWVFMWNHTHYESPFRVVALSGHHPAPGRLRAGGFSADGNSLVLYDDAHRLDLFDANTGAPYISLLEVDTRVDVLQFAGSGADYVMFTHLEDGTQLLHVPTNTPVLRIDSLGGLDGEVDKKTMEHCYGPDDVRGNAPSCDWCHVSDGTGLKPDPH